MHNTYLVKTCWRHGRSLGGGRGRNGTSPSSMRWKSLGMPGKIHSLPSSRTTGCSSAHTAISPRQRTANKHYYYSEW